MKYYTILIILVILQACQSSDQPDYYFGQAQKDSLLVQMIAYVGPNADMATDSTRMEDRFKSTYAASLSKYQLVNVFKNKEGIYTYFLIRPVANLLQYKRGVIGTFRLDEQTGKITFFNEVVNTPHLKEKELQERGAFLFREMVKKGHLDEYLAMKDYIEWPDSTLKYNMKLHRWMYSHAKF